MKYLTILFPILFSGCIGLGVVHQHEIDETMNIGKSFDELDKIYKFQKDGNIYLSKTDEFNWIGVVPMIGIGIPIIVPIGYNYEKFEFKDNKCIKESIESTTWSGYMCGLLNENGSTGCSKLH